MGKTEAQVLDELREVLREPDCLYKQSVPGRPNPVNNSGFTTVDNNDSTVKTKRRITEIVAEELRADRSWQGIHRVVRENTYFMPHPAVERPRKGDASYEKSLAKSMMGESYDLLGTIIDYQTPLKHTLRNGEFGEIDLLSVRGSDLFMIELKAAYRKSGPNNETLLRAVLEVYTYSKQVQEDKLLRECEDRCRSLGINSAPDSIKTAVLLEHEGTKAQEELDDLENRPHLRHLIDELRVEVYTFVPGDYASTTRRL